MVGVIDYGAGNLASLTNAFSRLGVEVELCSTPHNIEKYTHLVLPGVGSFKLAMEKIIELNWPDTIKRVTAAGVPLLGICLGMQLLFEEGEEHGYCEGLGLFSGKVVEISNSQIKVPHVGWNSINHLISHPLLKGIRQGVDFYFVHSFHCIPSNSDHILATFKYGNEMVSAVAKDNIVGVQFHPEKSQPAGLKMLSNFVNWDGVC
jgi:glutamine amidotransferase